MATIKDVAKLAGVAVSTASNAVNGKPGVSEETKRKVMEAVKQLNYVPNNIAQGLVTKSTKRVAIVLSGTSSFNVFTNPIFFEVIKSITSELNKNGYDTLLNVINLEEEEDRIPLIAKNRSVDALIYTSTRKSDKDLEEIINHINIPTVIIIRGPIGKAYSVSLDNFNCGYMATKYLIEMGHRTIGFIGRLQGVSMAEERLEGYRVALKEYGIAYNETLVAEGDYYQESGLMAVRQLLRQSSQTPTAVFAGNDLMALGAMEGIEQEGFRIPEDISLIGCDNIPNLHLLKTPLTTVANPFSEIGRLAVAKVIGTLTGRDELPNNIMLESDLRIRNSVKKISD